MKKKFKIAIVGAGHIAQTFHIPAWIRSKKCEIISLCDKNSLKLKLMSKKFSIKDVYSNIDNLLKNKNLDVINISTPPYLHFKNIISSLKMGKNILVEKPFVLNNKDIEKINELVKKKSLYIQCALHQRFRPISKIIKEVINKNKIGKIYYINIVHRKFRSIPTQSAVFSDKKYSGGGPLIDLGSHYFDLIAWILGFPKIKKVNCKISNKIFSTYKLRKYLPFKKFSNEESAFGNITLRDETYINFEISYAINTKEEDIKIEFFGSRGLITWPKKEYYVLEKNNLIKKKFTVRNKLASDEQINEFLKKLNKTNLNKKKLSKKNLKEYNYIVKLVNLLYDAAKK